MSDPSFKNIAIGIAYSPTLEANLSEAARLSCVLGAKLLLIHVGKGSTEKIQMIEQVIGNCKESSLNYEILFKEGKPVDVILEAVRVYHIDLLLLGALKQEGFVKFYLGPIARKITRKATCSVLLMTNPSVINRGRKHLIVNGLIEAHAKRTIATAFYVAQRLGSNQLTIVEEIEDEKIPIKINDDQSLRKANLLKEKLKRQQESRIHGILSHIPEEQKKYLHIETQAIFGKRGYSIGHYAQIVRADLLVMSGPKKSAVFNKFFPDDLEYLLKELPSDVLVVR